MPSRKVSRNNSRMDNNVLLQSSDKDFLKEHNSPRPQKSINQKKNPEYSEDEETSDDSSQELSASPQKSSPESISGLKPLGRPSLDTVRRNYSTRNDTSYKDEKTAIHHSKEHNRFPVKKGIIIGCLMMILLPFAIFCIYFGWESNTSLSQKRNFKSLHSPSEQKGIQLIKRMKSLFPKQSHDTWINFYTALESVKEEEPSQPAVLLLTGENTSRSTNTIDCIAKKFAEITNEFLSDEPNHAEICIQIDSIAQLSKQQDEIVKREVDLRIRSILNQSNSIVLGHLEDLPPRAALLLHGYCDNFEAPFKKIVFILTATFKDKPIDSKQVDRKLKDLWARELGSDKSASLVSRVANSPVFIEPEMGSLPCQSNIPTEL